ncbi:MAG: sugar ABC transporter substrate-binding protein [Fimbriimonadaceae bacterium]
MKLASAIAVAFVLFGCTGVDRNVVRMADWGGAGDDSEFNRLINRVYAEFEEQNPGVDLRVEGTPDMPTYVTKMLLSHVAGTAPDVMRLDASSAAVFIENGVLLDLSSYIARDAEFSLDDYFPNVVDITRRGEAVYAIPVGFTPMVLYYNKDLFDASGVEYPDGTWTYAEFLDAARRLTTEDVYGFEFTNWMAMWILFLWNNGGDVLRADGSGATGAFDSPECIEAVQFLHDMVNVHKAAPTKSQTAAMGVNLFASGRAAMKIVGHWELIDYVKDTATVRVDRIGIAPPPSNLSRPVTVMYESGLAVMKNCKNPDLAWELIKYLSGYDVQARYNATGIEVSALRRIAQEAGDPTKTDALGRVVPAALERAFGDVVPLARGPWGARVERYNLVEPIGEKMMDRVLNQGVSPAVALRDAAREIDRELTKK